MFERTLLSLLSRAGLLDCVMGRGFCFWKLSALWVSLSIFVPVLWCPNHCGFIMGLISGSTSLPNLLFVFMIFLAIPCPFAFSYKFCISLSISANNKPTVILTEIALSSDISQGERTCLQYCSFPIHEHGLFLYLFRPLLIALTFCSFRCGGLACFHHHETSSYSETYAILQD